MDRTRMSDTSKPESGKNAHVTMAVTDRTLRNRIRAALESLPPPISVAMEEVQYCDFGMRISDGKETVVVRQYSSGKLVLQGKNDGLFREVVTVVEDACNSGGRRTPSHTPTPNTAPRSSRPAGYPYVGIDESGKGDYFGPLVIAAVCLDERSEAQLNRLGVRDSKELTDQRCMELAKRIKETCPDAYSIVEIPPNRYNALYREFRAEKQNLNNLLAWGHARALENLLEKANCLYAISDQFGNANYIRSKLMAKGASVRLLQEPGAEKYTAVAAASILARDRFLFRLKALGDELGMTLPKGASSGVVEAAKAVAAAKGPTALANVAKLHFKTTEHALGAAAKKLV